MASYERLSQHDDDYVFQFNQRLSRHRGNLIYRLMQQELTTKTMTLGKNIAKGHSWQPQHVVLTWVKGIPSLEKLEAEISSSENIEELDLELAIRHAYHHINSAWNIRNIEKDKYTNMTETDFKEWGKFPKGLREGGTLVKN